MYDLHLFSGRLFDGNPLFAVSFHLRCALIYPYSNQNDETKAMLQWIPPKKSKNMPEICQTISIFVICEQSWTDLTDSFFVFKFFLVVTDCLWSWRWCKWLIFALELCTPSPYFHTICRSSGSLVVLPALESTRAIRRFLLNIYFLWRWGRVDMDNEERSSDAHSLSLLGL